jgi:hypothetical protein
MYITLTYITHFYEGKSYYELTTWKTWKRKTKMKINTDDIFDTETKMWGRRYIEQAQTHEEQG